MTKEIIEYWEKKWPKETPRHIDYDELPLAELLRKTVIGKILKRELRKEGD